MFESEVLSSNPCPIDTNGFPLQLRLDTVTANLSRTAYTFVHLVASTTDLVTDATLDD